MCLLLVRKLADGEVRLLLASTRSTEGYAQDLHLCSTGARTLRVDVHLARSRLRHRLGQGTFCAAIFIFSPVCGFLPSLTLRSLTENFPKPVIWTSSPALSASVTTFSKASKCFWASLLGTPASWAILSMSSFFFMFAPFCGRPRPLGGLVWSAYSLFIREPESLATPSLPADLAKRKLWGCTGRGAPHLVQAPRKGAW